MRMYTVITLRLHMVSVAAALATEEFRSRYVFTGESKAKAKHHNKE